MDSDTTPDESTAPSEAMTPSESVAAELVADDTADVLGGQDDVVDAVLAANRVFVAVAAGALADVEPQVTMPQFRALVLIDLHGAMTVAHLADALGVVPSTATRMCDRLVSKQLVERTTSQTDRRQVELVLSTEGRALIRQSTVKRTRRIRDLLAAIPPESQADLAQSLGRLVQAARTSDATRSSLSAGPGDDPSRERGAR